jgi:TonB family protein
MPGKTRPYEQFGSYILFKKLESDALGELWRAARIDDRHLGPLVALRRLTGGDRPSLTQAVTDARNVAPLLTGTSFVKDQVFDVVNGIPFIAHEYGGGKSLRHIVDRARGGNGITPNPIPIEEAVVIAEKVALSLATTAELRYDGDRLSHGALIPQFIWISDDGDIRVAGQQLGKGLIASLKDGKIGATIGRYFSPEYQHRGEATKASDVYAMGAILFLLVTGTEPPDAVSASAFAQSVRAAKTMTGQPIPDDIRAILDKSLVIDSARRFDSIATMKQALSTLVHGGKYAATTFNLAFYLNTLLKKEMEGETIDREKESKLNIASYLEHRTLEVVAPPPFAPPVEKKPARSGSVLYASVAVVAVVLAVAAFLMMRGPSTKTVAQITPPATPSVVSQPAVPEPPAAKETVDPVAQKKAFEAAVNQRLQEEMMKLQSQFNRDLQQKKSKNAPLQSPPVVLTASAAPQRPPQVMDDRTPSAAALDERRLASRQEAPAAVTSTQPPPVTQTQAQSAPQPQSQPQPVVPAPAQAPAIKEGDVVNFAELDTPPQPITRPRVSYPPLAMRQRAQASLILTMLVSENGDVLDVKILKGDPRFGFNDEAMRALRATRFRPAMKDGKRVKTWLPQPVDFRLQ